MKDTGIKWIGEIPDTWNIIKVKYNCSLKGRIGWQGLTTDEYIDEGPILITGTDFDNGTINWDSCVHVSEWRYDQAPEIQVKAGDLLITKDGTIGKVAIVDKLQDKTTLNSGVMVIRPTKDTYNSRFLYYVLKSEEFWKWFNYINAGNTTISHLYQHDFKNFYFAITGIDEQNKIVDFLDDKCYRIDKVISNVREQIKILETTKKSIITESVTKGVSVNADMKDSGVDWIGKIPLHWKMNKIRYISTLRVEKGKYTPDDIYVGLENIESNTGKYIETNTEYVENVYDMFYAGDILFNKLRPYLAKTLMPDFDGYCTGELTVIKEVRGIKKFLFYYFFSDGFLTVVNASTYGAKMPRANWDFIKNLSIPEPPIEEQQIIVDYLDKKCSIIDKIIKKKQLELDILQAHKKSLINEYITGKKRVKEYI